MAGGGGAGGPPRRPLCLAEVEAGSENERLGVARDSMLRNPLILKAELGKPQRNCYTLPGFDFSYGLYIERTDGGVPEAIGHWNTIKPRTDLAPNMPRDFITMNRGALKAGYTTAREFNLYYKAKDIRRKDDEYSRFKRSPPKVPADMTYGIPARPSTPFFDVLHHKYKELWMEQQRALTAAQRVEKKKKDKRRETRTTFLRKQPAPAKEESFWHLPHLEKVGPHLSTFPDHNARKKAFSASH
ncbi:cilia- and flagella-associated protein 77 [Oxyura jamaicensis]|uniref:cilia- and flagella-associated protein 77 n=1 Tax=Oxyura jamaicensis TaxID=8884 RepID=UPI0015A510DD|nr:cilia- and flagella-associated protein 77 [Oxyura jamaicensis]